MTIARPTGSPGTGAANSILVLAMPVGFW